MKNLDQGGWSCYIKMDVSKSHLILILLILMVVIVVHISTSHGVNLIFVWIFCDYLVAAKLTSLLSAKSSHIFCSLMIIHTHTHTHFNVQPTLVLSLQWCCVNNCHKILTVFRSGLAVFSVTVCSLVTTLPHSVLVFSLSRPRFSWTFNDYSNYCPIG